MRREFKLTDDQLNQLKAACQPVPYLVFGGKEPASPQEHANRAWITLGHKLMFDGLTVEPSEKGVMFFTADVAV